MLTVCGVLAFCDGLPHSLWKCGWFLDTHPIAIVYRAVCHLLTVCGQHCVFHSLPDPKHTVCLPFTRHFHRLIVQGLHPPCPPPLGLPSPTPLTPYLGLLGTEGNPLENRAPTVPPPPHSFRTPNSSGAR